MSSLPLSCYIRTKNEEALIRRTLESVLALGIEVVLVDSGSTDRTVAIAEEMGCRVIHQPWLGNGKQKRVGEDACRHDWLLDIDADEVLSEELREEIQALFATGTPPCSMYQLKLVTFPPFGNAWVNHSLCYRIKLYDRRVIRIPEHAAWDQFEVPPGAKVGLLSGAIQHYSFKNVEHFLEKLNRVSSVRAREKKLPSMPVIVMRIVFGFPCYFFKKYVMKKMFMGGVYGFAIAAVLAASRWLTDVKMYEIRHLKK